MLKVHKSKIVRGAAALAALSAGAVATIGTASPAGADPKWPSALVGHGSDTTQDVIGALAGEESGTFYIPVSSSQGGAQVLNSWDATGTAPCVTPRASGVQVTRANGSGAGRTMLSRAIDGGLYGSGNCGAPRSPNGLIDFARSSSGPGSAGGTGLPLTYIPYGKDAVSFAYAVNGVANPVTTLTSAQLTQIFSTDGGATISGVHILGCGIQTSSGTYSFWNQALGINSETEGTGTADCVAAGNGQRLQENDGNGLKAKADALPAGTQVIVGFSAANYISQNNGVVASQLPSPAGTVRLGQINALGLPYTGNPGTNQTPNASFYASTTFGRFVYNVVSTTRLAPPASSNSALKTMFVGSTSAVCAAGTTISKFGFLTIGTDCGSTTLTGPLSS